MQKTENPYYKIVTLGEGRVGKTSLIVRFVNDNFDPHQPSTRPSQNISYVEKQVKLETGEDLTIALSDTAGQERFSAMAPLYYKGAHAAVVVYDITFKESLNKLEKWINELK